MEQLAPVINWIKNNRFWLGCALVALLMSGVFLAANNAANKERQSRERTIRGLEDTVRSIRNTNPAGIDSEEARAHPNDATNQGMLERISEAEDAAIKAWVLRYNEQKELLVFPEEEIGNKKLVETISQFVPAEKGIDMQDAFDATGANFREIYKNMLPRRIDNLTDIVGTTWKFKPETTTEKSDNDAGDQISTPEGGGAGATPDGGGAGFNLNADIVKWNEDNQELWHQKITQFRGDDGAPTLYEILLLQEDLWVFESVLNIIAEVNKGADANDLADVKQIDHILIGREAYLDQSEINIAEPNVAAPKMDDPAAGGGAPGGDATSSAPDGKLAGNKQKFRGGKGGSTQRPVDRAGGGFDFKGSPDPSHGRYVDSNFLPIPATEVVQGVMATELTNYASLTVAKRIPVRIGVVMNEKQIGEFLSACANSKLVFEVRQVRVNRHTPGDGEFILNNTTNQTGGSGAGTGMNQPSAPMNAPSASGGGAAGAGASVGGEFESSGSRRDDDLGGDGPGSVDTRTDYDVMVEFYGIVKIYNPPKYELLGGQNPNPDAGTNQAPAGDNKKTNPKPKAKP